MRITLLTLIFLFLALIAKPKKFYADDLSSQQTLHYSSDSSFQAFIAKKMTNSNEQEEKIYSSYIYEYFDAYPNIDSVKIEFDLDHDRDTDYGVLYCKPKGSSKYFVYDNVLQRYIQDTLMSSKPFLFLDLRKGSLVLADYQMPQFNHVNIIETYVRFNFKWYFLERELQDYLRPHNQTIDNTIRKLNDTLSHYDSRSKRFTQNADYNFDGYIDMRMAYDSIVQFRNTSYYADRFEYYLFDNEKGKFIKDEFLSSGVFNFDTKNKKANGYIVKKEYDKDRRGRSTYDKYEWINNQFVKTEIVVQVQACPLCEKINTYVYRMINGQWQEVEFIPGPE